MPVVGSALPARFTLYTSLLAGLLVAIALAERGSRFRWGAGARRDRPDAAEPRLATVVVARSAPASVRSRAVCEARSGRRDSARPSLRPRRLVDAVAGRGGLSVPARRRPLRVAGHPCRAHLARRVRGAQCRQGRAAAASELPGEALRRCCRRDAGDARECAEDGRGGRRCTARAGPDSLIYRLRPREARTGARAGDRARACAFAR